jgi:predicted enzyme related to lactoylglutathione lyase
MGRVVHFEIPADDIDRAREFYREAFGWTMNPIPDMGYTIVQTGEADANGRPAESGFINGGMLTRQGPVTSPVVTIEVDDIDAALPAVEKLGGSVARATMAVGDMGFAAYVVDTEGNVIGLWQNAARG